ncbi:MAG: tRNA (adenosine(37)-N6)-threonylcarbamoyltransferase complex transferase subunit TsaD [Angelakisella sp.]|nr:tRNA (adenosine(37)-N6)-threonylcarbamoyltransferase complex transferase subunit TsaD [Angelakisella sp.]
MKLLSIESSCDETAAAVVEDGRKVLSSVVDSQVEEHKKYGGVVPEIASRRHTENIIAVVEQALEEANLTLDEIDGIAVTAAPGLIGAVLVGVNFAKGLAFSRGLPLIPVHHIRGHVAANYLCFPNLEPPFLCLIVSGGHSHIAIVKDYTTFEILGRTRDDAAGEAFDKAARSIGLGYPGGIAMDKISRKGNPNAYVLPTPKTENPLDFSFSGLKTAVINLAHNMAQKGENLVPEDMAASFCSKVADILWQHFEMAADQTCIKKLALAGGVSANSWLRSKAQERCAARGFELYMPQLQYCGDNAAMIGAQGYYEFLAGNTAGMDLNGRPYMELGDSF